MGLRSNRMLMWMGTQRSAAIRRSGRSVSIGTKTQDLKFRGAKTYVVIGKNAEIREFTTINSSTCEGSTVRVGDHCLIMASCHIAHHCEVGNHVIMSNNSLLAGHVIVEDYAIIGGLTPIHQFTRIGCHAMVGGMSRVTLDVPSLYHWGWHTLFSGRD